ncbi:2-hydroxyacid dehydrogenase [Sodiomyces alkalinus F11]|uniref:2-hydroxyacid dehydrogenase n=1 Tax=Sodiomyces alkalinus (strain CBS 110278 / VKM F-3762 / F11) TaxID=1314773 RepID=A0A3N2PKZ7_SODAK|nr:2-hydroxyacid dehydrogenase [Sodiomyces alkalinus F11]ROT35192.1 2-hydroxyacid dehydrogenase [Sodiomyces alkalinus F11]
MEDAPDLSYIHFCSSGTDHIVQHPVYTQSSVLMTTSRGIAGPPIAEWVVMTALVHCHKYNYSRELHLKRQWSSGADFMSCRDVVGQRIGIVGYGGIGRHVARIAKAMAMDVYAFTATPRETPEQRRDTGYTVPNTGDPDGSIPTRWFSGLDKPSFHEFLRQDLDIVVLCLPLTPQTRHILSTAEFEILSRRQSFVSNISRGETIDQTALIAALETGQLRGAALDVTDPEPLPADSPLWTAPNIIISPHMSGLIANYGDRTIDVLELNLERKSRGEPMVNVIQRGKGY